LAGFTRDLGVHDHEKQEIAEFFPKMRGVLRAGRFCNFISFLDILIFGPVSRLVNTSDSLQRETGAATVLAYAS
jgi:hypothetical protein